MPKLTPLAWVYVAIAVGCALLLGVVKYQEGKIADLNKDAGAAVVHVEAAKATVDLKEKSDKVDEVAITNVVVKEREVKQTTDKHIKNVQVKVENIIKEESLKPSTPETVAQTDREISKVRITSLWDSYRAAVAGIPVTETTNPESHDDDVAQKEPTGSSS